jgi:CobQ-like glutamine amidotransferase family enzyme
MTALTIVHLYPRELGINGDVGNVTALVERARWRGIPVAVHAHHPGRVPLPDADIIHIGSGPISGQRAVYADLQRIAPALRDAVASGVPLLAIAGGWQLLGRELVEPNGDRLVGAGVFPTRAVLSARRTVGEILVRTGGGMLAGFENHSAVTTLDDGAAPLGRVVAGGGNTPGAPAETRAEGVRLGSSIGTHLHGSFLPMNPSIADELLREALRRRGGSQAWQDPDALLEVDRYAAATRAAIASRLRVRG